MSVTAPSVLRNTKHPAEANDLIGAKDVEALLQACASHYCSGDQFDEGRLRDDLEAIQRTLPRIHETWRNYWQDASLRRHLEYYALFGTASYRGAAGCFLKHFV